MTERDEIVKRATTLDGAEYVDGVLDAAQFDGLRRLFAPRGDVRLLQEFVDQYVQDATDQLAELWAATARGDAPAVGLAAHGLRGTSATIGAARVAAACATLESSAARGQTAEPDALDRVAVELQRATTALRTQAPAG